MMTRQICKALAILNRRPLQGAARPGAALGGSGCDRHERVGEHVRVDQVVQGHALVRNVAIRLSLAIFEPRQHPLDL
jgi:hypothetical protein